MHIINCRGLAMKRFLIAIVLVCLIFSSMPMANANEDHTWKNTATESSIVSMHFDMPEIEVLNGKYYIRLGELPFVNTNPDTIYDNLKDLILNPEKRHEIGKKSREYVERYHDVNVVIDDLLNIYQVFLNRNVK